MSTNTHPYSKESPYYSTGTHLREKHKQVRFTSGRQFHEWALDLVPISPASRILDAGCGWGRFTWHAVEHKGVSPANIVCSDRSVNMLKTLIEEKNRRSAPINVVASDIEAVPLKFESFDIVMANHVLYHATNIDKAVEELSRMMKDEGILLATTNSDNVEVTIVKLHYQALEALDVEFEPESPSPFSMENGGAYLKRVFQEVDVHYFEDTTIYDDADEFVNMYLSIGRYRNFIAREDIGQATKEALPRVYKDLVQEIIEREGKLVTPVLMGAFVCTKPRRNT